MVALSYRYRHQAGYELGALYPPRALSNMKATLITVRLLNEASMAKLQAGTHPHYAGIYL